MVNRIRDTCVALFGFIVNAHRDPPGSPRSVLRELFAGSGASTTTDALEQAAARARAHGFVVLQLGVLAPSSLRDLVDLHAAIALQCVRHGRAAAPTAILSGGAPPAVAERAGHAEFLLALALALHEQRAMYGCAYGPSRNPDGSAGCGLYFAPDTIARALQMSIVLAERLAAGEAASVFVQLGDYEAQPAAGFGERVLRSILITQE